THLNRIVQQIKEAGMKAGVTLNPSTPVCLLRDIIADLDLVLLMSVNPGFGGQRFIPNTINKVKELRKLIEETHSKALIEVDGGVNLETGKLLKDAGADILVAGNFVFNSPTPKQEIAQLHSL
ncbi:MAG: ribulose-phosphate 3-epimerase, partial [Muribaculaceae bacterium]